MIKYDIQIKNLEDKLSESAHKFNFKLIKYIHKKNVKITYKYNLLY